MSCLNIRLQPAKKAWKSFTSIFQTKLHKLNKSKAIKKPHKNINTNDRLQKAASKTTRPSLFLGQRLQLKTKRRCRALPFGYKRYYISESKAAAPVYIDKLFKDVPASELVGYIHKRPLEKKLDDEAEDAGTSKEEEISMESTMLYGVDARAEEFIASFRKEMERQEIIARNL